MLGYKGLFGQEKLKWYQDDNELIIEIPQKLQAEENRPCKQAWAFRIELPPKTP